METKDFYYDLPEELIAQVPLKDRTNSRLLVLDKGSVKEFDKPLELFKHNGIFREMCDKSKITESDFEK